MSKCTFAPQARHDLIEIHDYIAKDNPGGAARFIALLEEKCRFLAKYPKIGRERFQFGPSIRSFPVGSYIIFYRPVEGGVEIAHVLHGKRNFLAFFKNN